MKIILSRKGFDSSNGGMPSPILPDGTMLSMPINNDCDKLTYAGIYFKGEAYADYLVQLNPKEQWHRKHCHLDPDIRKGAQAIDKWKPAFGQQSAAESHLSKNGVGSGDLFLFFGWFRETEYNNGKILFDVSKPHIQAIYGYLQIAERLTGEQIKDYQWHPHSEPHHLYAKHNVIYSSQKRLLLGGKDLGSGSGVFKFNEKIQLTEPGMSRSKWKLQPWMTKELQMTYHSNNAIKEGFFQSANRGQEFVIDANDAVMKWVIELFAT